VEATGAPQPTAGASPGAAAWLGSLGVPHSGDATGVAVLGCAVGGLGLTFHPVDAPQPVGAAASGLELAAHFCRVWNVFREFQLIG
jgi:hypothetical protein